VCTCLLFRPWVNSLSKHYIWFYFSFINSVCHVVLFEELISAILTLQMHLSLAKQGPTQIKSIWREFVLNFHSEFSLLPDCRELRWRPGMSPAESKCDSKTGICSGTENCYISVLHRNWVSCNILDYVRSDDLISVNLTKYPRNVLNFVT
jgi:hypothetical protein